jgi:hypothetical protein
LNGAGLQGKTMKVSSFSILIEQICYLVIKNKKKHLNQETLAKIRALARDEKTFYTRRDVDIDPALAPAVQRGLHELKASGISKVEGFWSREKAFKWGEDLARECRGSRGTSLF